MVWVQEEGTQRRRQLPFMARKTSLSTGDNRMVVTSVGLTVVFTSPTTMELEQTLRELTPATLNTCMQARYVFPASIVTLVSVT